MVKPVINQETQLKIEALVKSLEESLKYLREHVTSDNLEVIKIKAESVKLEYINKFKEAGANEDMIKKLEERFNEFFKNLSVKINNEVRPLLNNEIRPESKTDAKIEGNPELKKVMDELKISLDESLKYLIDHITDTNLDEIKSKLESLKE
jgi:hypothetical protein